MRRFFERRPSPGTALAFVALLAALSGTAVALPGTGIVDSGDIKNNSIRSKDVRNNNLRGTDVRNGSITGADVRDNSLTGADLNESTLGTVPNANQANSANTANTANSATNATNAGTASQLAGLARSGQVTASDGQIVTVLAIGAWRVIMDCDVSGPTNLELENVSAGNDSHASANDPLDINDQDVDLDQGDSILVAQTEVVAEDTKVGNFSGLGSGGSVIHGQGIVSHGTNDTFATPGCVASAFAFSS